MFNNLLTDGFKMRERNTITAGIARTTEAKNNFMGESSKLLPSTSPFAFPGVYNSK